MTDVIRFTDGIAVELAHRATVERGATRGADKIAELGQSFGVTIYEQLKPIAEKTISVFKELDVDQVEVELGLKLTAEAGAIIAKTVSEGHLIIKFSWAKGSDRSSVVSE